MDFVRARALARDVSATLLDLNEWDGVAQEIELVENKTKCLPPGSTTHGAIDRYVSTPELL